MFDNNTTDYEILIRPLTSGEAPLTLAEIYGDDNLQLLVRFLEILTREPDVIAFLATQPNPLPVFQDMTFGDGSGDVIDCTLDAGLAGAAATRRGVAVRKGLIAHKDIIALDLETKKLMIMPGSFIPCAHKH